MPAAFAPVAYAVTIGQSAEFGDRPLGTPVRLCCARRAPGSGWTAYDATATPIRRPAYRSPENREILGPGGPVTMESDGFYDGGWGGWSEKTFEGLDENLILWRDAVGKLTDVFDKFSPGDAMRDVPDEYYPQVVAKVRDYMDTLRAKVGAEVRAAQDALDAAHGVFRKDATSTALDRGGLKAILGR